MITPDSTLREIAAAAFDVGFRLTITPAPLPTRADRITAEHGPRGYCWRWYGPWRRWEGDDKEYSPPPGWERAFLVPAQDVETGELLWDRKYGTLNIIMLYDEPLPDWHATAL